MRKAKVLVLLLCIIFIAVKKLKASTYYFSSSSGLDSRSYLEAQNPSTPWRTLSKLKDIDSILSPGDSILFNRGDVFTGNITLLVNAIYLGAYGNGNKPIISGLITVSDWKNTSNGIREAYCSKCLVDENLVVIDGDIKAMARFPNKGYLPYQNFSANTSIRSSSLKGLPDFTGAEVVIRKERYIIDRGHITSQSGGKIDYTNGSYDGNNGYGFFIQNDIKALDTSGEWVYNPTTAKLAVYGNFSRVQASMIDTLVTVNANNVTLENLELEGANRVTIEIINSHNTVIKNCNLNFSGRDAISGKNSADISLLNNTIANSLNNGIELDENCVNAQVFYNKVTNTFLYPGMGAGGIGSGNAVQIFGSGSVVQFNTIRRSGAGGISFTGSNSIVKKNVVDSFAFNKDDAGGIYIGIVGAGSKYIDSNIVYNGVGAGEGTPYPNQLFAEGIYIDDNLSDVFIKGNAVFNCSDAGIKVHNCHEINIIANTLYNNLHQLHIEHNAKGEMSIRNLNISNNIFASTDSQYCLWISSFDNDLNQFGTTNDNYYVFPSKKSFAFWTHDPVNNKLWYEGNQRTLSEWKAIYRQDLNSKKIFTNINDYNKDIFKYNEGGSTRKFYIPGTYISVDSTIYSGSVTLKPYTSIILIKISDSKLQNLSIDAGRDTSLHQPTQSFYLKGIVDDSVGSSAISYLWKLVSGPSGVRILSPQTLATQVRFAQAGTYAFALTATDSKTNISDTVVIKVLPQPVNQPPTADAGHNMTITLPANSVNLDGSSSVDADGSIVDFQWKKLSGPSKYNIIAPDAAATQINNLVAGTYLFSLLVTDNEGGKDTAIVKVVVNPVVNRPPTATISNTTIAFTLPQDSAKLDGSSSTDGDGKITSYQWQQVSGPSAAVINDNNVPATEVAGLVSGSYIFELTVTDSNGASSSAQVTVTVSPRPNSAPNAKVKDDLLTLKLPQDSVRLDGSISNDSVGNIITYQWKQISGPSTSVIADANSPATEVGGLQTGSYVFQLIVKDNDGAADSTSVKVVVDPAANKPPKALVDKAVQSVTLPQDSVLLDGLLSYDSDGRITSYQWTQQSGPGSANIVSTDSAVSRATNLSVGSYLFQLKVTDNNGGSDSTVIKMTINPAPNKAPVAKVKDNNIIVSLPLDSVTLDASSSADADGDAITYHWEAVSAPSTYNIVSPNAAVTTIKSLQEGNYIFELIVSDKDGAKDSAFVKVKVNPLPNKAPLAKIKEAEIRITLPDNTVTLDGSASTDPDGNIISYSWKALSGSSGATAIITAKAATTAVQNLSAGTYHFQLTVTDNNDATDSAEVIVYVDPAPNKPPVAKVNNQEFTITLPEDAVVLDGSASTDSDGQIIAYQWKQEIGPSGAEIVNANLSKTTVAGLQAGLYIFQLSVKDNAGAITNAQVTVTVKQAPNKVPVANAGKAIILTLPEDSATLDASASFDPDGTIVSYSWKEISGPSSFKINYISTNKAIVSALVAGQYTFQLTVKDNRGAMATAQVEILIEKANVPPVADAGADTSITIPNNNLELTANGSYDIDGIITGYRWLQLYGPVAARMSDSSGQSIHLTALAPGQYLFMLTVTDNYHAVASDTVSVLVKPGHQLADQSMVLYPNPASSVTNMRLYIPQTGKMQVTIFDTNGGVKKKLSFTKSQQYYNQDIDLSTLPAGLYLVQTQIGNFITVNKLVKL